MPNTLIFVDLPADDPAAAARFYAEVFGWRDDHKPLGIYHRMVPGGMFANPDGTESLVGNLHVGIFNPANARPHPDPSGVEPRSIAAEGRKPRIWVLIGDDDTPERILSAAEERGATVLWRDHFWSTFNGLNHAFRDPWGNEIVLWGKAGDPPAVPEGYTRE
ncbi:VOC family protein [Novosphingobium guangzhouense]|uniref:Glyoxalase n=1 Tax=Novosphingobium guangzhouense TaxID=1850347 RepID=A0A2K2G7A1_9SPHN|nr:VOC family protein [Novosphingobium guangzhouense]PNU06900.1 glyoxalase [Novosphingobium guangzhouense]